MSAPLLNPTLEDRIPGMLWDWEKERVCIIVGVVTSNDTFVVIDLWEAENRHHNPYDHFALTRPQWDGFKRKAAKNGFQVLGIGHSHPFGHLDGPSPDDLRLAGSRIANFVYHSASSNLHWYRKSGVFSSSKVRMPARIALLNRFAHVLDRISV